jgi:hypothetical protein
MAIETIAIETILTSDAQVTKMGTPVTPTLTMMNPMKLPLDHSQNNNFVHFELLLRTLGWKHPLSAEIVTAQKVHDKG